VDAISAASEDLLDHAAPAAATVLNSVRAEETVLLDMEQRKLTGRPPSYVLSAEDLAVLNTPGKTLADMVAHLGRKYPIITERIVQSLRTKRVPSAGRIDLRLRVTIYVVPGSTYCINVSSPPSPGLRGSSPVVTWAVCAVTAGIVATSAAAAGN
jgi:hypothetical protein